MSIQATRNLYPGVNPHLNSQLQTPGSHDVISLWEGFHSAHIGYIAEALNLTLPPSYYALQEQSLQIRLDDWDTGFSRKQGRRPDVTIYGSVAGSLAVSGATAEAFDLDLMDTFGEEELYFSGVVIREQRSGDVVTRIEVLSPANKPGYAAYFAYRRKRIETLMTGTPLVEIDYLHETTPVLDKVPVYPADTNAFPYSIYVNDPRPSVKEGRLRAYGAWVGDKLPPCTVPLIDAETVTFDLDSVYQKTFSIGRWGKRLYINYLDQPARFDTYSPADQARILQRMASIAAAVARGDDLETVELPSLGL